MDPGRNKNQSSWNHMKPMPLRLSRRVDSDHIMVFANGHRMRKLLHSD
jgi:hypothetical protein